MEEFSILCSCDPDILSIKLNRAMTSLVMLDFEIGHK